MPTFPKHVLLKGCSRGQYSIRIAAPQRRRIKIRLAPMHLGYTGYIGKRFCKSTCFHPLRRLRRFSQSSVRLHPQEACCFAESMGRTTTEVVEEPSAPSLSTAEKSERPEQNQDLRCQSGPFSQRFSHSSVKRNNRTLKQAFDPLFKELWSSADQQRLQIKCETNHSINNKSHQARHQ